jgi:4-nitrophenyl phosphatase
MRNLADIKAILIDMDGVLYRGKTALPGSADLFRFLEEQEIKYLVVTNNSTLSQAMFAERLQGMGMDIPENLIMTSGVATAAYLAVRVPAGSTVFVVGEEPLVQEMVKHGLVLAGRDAQYVVVGWDKTINFEKLKTATLAIRAGATFIGTNPDKTYPLENDIIPGAGSIIAAVAAATDKEPLIIGKPQPLIFQQALAQLGVPAEQSASLGDRLETDILGGYRLGMQTILVLTGIATAEEATQAEVKPDYTFSDLPALLAAWQQALDE